MPLDIAPAQVTQVTVPEFNKVQWIRLVDVFVIGPFWIYMGIKYRKKLEPWECFAMIAFGVTTTTYNFENYMRNKNKQV